METQRTHPLIIAAAVSVILASGVGVASMTGLLGESKATNAPEALTQAADSTATPNTPALTAQAPAAAQAPVAQQQAPAQPAAPRHTAPKAAVNNSPKPAQVAAAAPVVERAPVCNSCGEVVAVREQKVKGEGSGAGAVAGGIAGAVAGKQIGNGNGSKAMAVLGAVGGAYLGNKIEKEVRSSTVFEVVVELENGGTRTFTFQERPTWQRGDKVRVVDNELQVRG